MSNAPVNTSNAPANTSNAQLPRSAATDWHAARALAFEVASVLTSESVALSDAVGRVLAVDLPALTDVPHYSSSAMDGWAVCGPPPWTIDVAVSPLTPGFAYPIVTGALIPEGTEAVLRSESGVLTRHGDANLLESSVDFEPHPGQHVRAPAREARLGDTVIAAGTVLNPAHIAVAAVCGHDLLCVVQRPRVALLLTGDEVVDAGIPQAGTVRDSFSPQLPGLIGMLGGSMTTVSRVADTLTATVTALRLASSGTQVVVTTGGTGDSSVDHLHAAVKELGAELLVSRVAMRPGGPTMLARLSTGAILIALPGNPLAAMIGLLSIGVPVISAFAGLPLPRAITVTAGEKFDGRESTTILVPYRLEKGVAIASRWQGSAMMRGLADAAGVLVVESGGLRPGQSAEALALPWVSASAESAGSVS